MLEWHFDHKFQMVSYLPVESQAESESEEL